MRVANKGTFVDQRTRAQKGRLHRAPRTSATLYVAEFMTRAGKIRVRLQFRCALRSAYGVAEEAAAKLWRSSARARVVWPVPVRLVRLRDLHELGVFIVDLRMAFQVVGGL